MTFGRLLVRARRAFPAQSLWRNPVRLFRKTPDMPSLQQKSSWVRMLLFGLLALLIVEPGCANDLILKLIRMVII
jgi:hypothetical protein